MSTNARVGYVRDDGKVEHIYVHWDGYLQGAGETLLNNYDSKEKLEKLMKLGNLSILGTEPIDFPDGWNGSTPDDRCLSYASRGDEHGNAYVSDLEDYVEDTVGSYEYAYLWNRGTWLWWKYGTMRGTVEAGLKKGAK